MSVARPPHRKSGCLWRETSENGRYVEQGVCRAYALGHRATVLWSEADKLKSWWQNAIQRLLGTPEKPEANVGRAAVFEAATIRDHGLHLRHLGQAQDLVAIEVQLCHAPVLYVHSRRRRDRRLGVAAAQVALDVLRERKKVVEARVQQLVDPSGIDGKVTVNQHVAKAGERTRPAKTPSWPSMSMALA